MTLLLLACSSPSTDLAVSEKAFGSPPPIPRTMNKVRKVGCGDLEEGYIQYVREAADLEALRDYDVLTGTVKFYTLTGVTDLDALECLARVEQMSIEDTEDLERIELHGLAVEALYLDDNPAVTEIVLDGIRIWSDGGSGFSDGVQIGDHPALARLAVTNSTMPLLNINTDVSDLSEVQATVETMLITSHTLADLSTLTASVESLAVDGDLLQTLELAGIEGMAVRVGDVPALTTLGSQRPVAMEHLYVWDAPLLEDLSLLEDLETAVGLSFKELPAEDLHLDALVEVETLHLTDLEGIDDISFPSLEEAGTISLYHGSDEADVDLVGVDIDTLAVYPDGDWTVDFDDVALLEILGVDDGSSVEVVPDELNAVLIAYCAGDGEIDLSAVTEVTGRFKVWQCTPLAHLSMPFESVGGNLVFDETGLVALDAPALETVGGGLQIVDNPDLSDISDLMSLVSVGGDITISGNPNLAAEDVDALIDAIDTIGGTVTVEDNG